MINGKFYSQKHRTGVFRVADRLTRQLDLICSTNGNDFKIEIAYPPDVISPPILDSIQSRMIGPLTWQAWEQVQLPAAANGKLLVNLCNLAPLADRGGITMIHDAQVFLSPQSYSSAFAAWYRFAMPQIGKGAANVITVSEYSRRQLANFGVCDYEKMTVVHNGADHILDVNSDDRIVERLKLERCSYVVALSTVQAHKNISVLLQAFSRPEIANLTLVLIGKATTDDFAAAGLAVPKNVVFSGVIGDGELRGLIENAACLAFPSTTEGFGLPPLEAMILGCPVVVAPCGALPEVCGDSVVYAAPHDPADWAAQVKMMSESPSHRLAWATKAKVHADSFRWARSAEALLSVIERFS